uniref:Lysosomal membrane ascorbate-dependent ferrireductase CYB561A3 n=1 Tax=Nothobranchius furzeri TaxID=105023 RepID=A0A8C6LSE4_NOTFU
VNNTVLIRSLKCKCLLSLLAFPFRRHQITGLHLHRPSNVFRVHLITTGAVLYRIPLTWGQNKLPWKLLHAAMMLLSLILAVVGLCAVFDVHNAQKTANLYSLHSWIGICTAALFAMQWLLGFAGFLLPCSPVALRQLLKPVHVWLGSSILMLSVAACISGINEKLFFVLLPAEAVLANSLGALIVAFGLVVLMILSNGKWQRADPGPEDLTYTWCCAEKSMPAESGMTCY